MYKSVTRSIQVTVKPSYEEDRSSPDQNIYFWSYTIELLNLGLETVQLKSRYWRIIDGNGRVQEVRGPGVVGEFPVLKPGDPYSYTSGCPLQTPSGFMVGTYEMESEAGQVFDVEIPAFALDLPNVSRVLN